MNEISTPHRRPHRRRLIIGGLATAGAVAAATVATLSGGGSGTTTHPARLMAASEVLAKASDAAAAQPDLKPRPGQYLYFSSVSRSGTGARQPRKAWLSVDGKHAGLVDQVEGGQRMRLWLCDRPKSSGGALGDKGIDQRVDLAHPPAGCDDQPAYDSSIPTDPAAAKAWLYRNSRGGNPPDVQAFVTVGDTIRERYIGSKALAALFKAAAQIPGVKVYRNITDLAGRTGIAVGQTWNGTRQELIFDPKTFKLIGEQQAYDPDTSFRPTGGAKTPGPVSKGDRPAYGSAMLGFGIVDRPGKLP